MAADVVLRYRSVGAAQAAGEAKALGREVDALGRKRVDVNTAGAVASLQRYGAAADRAGAKLLAFGRTSTRLVTAPVVGGLALSVKAFADFDAAMTKSLAVMGDVAPGLRRQMEQVARGSAKQLGLAAKDTAAGFYYLASSGLTAKQSMAALPVVARLARAGFMDMETATSLLVDSQSALGLKSKDAATNMHNLTRVSDVFSKSADASNASIEQMAEAMTNKAGAALRFVKKPIEEGAAALAYMADQGTKGEKAGEYLAIGLRDIARAAGTHAQAFKDAGISVLDYRGNLKPIATIADEFTRKTKGMGDAQKYALLDQLGLTRSVGDFIRSINGGGDAIRRYQAKITGATDYTAKVAGRQMESFSLKMAALKSRVVDAGISLGTILAPGVLAVADSFAGMLESVERFPAGAQKAIGVGVALAAALGPLALVTGGIAKGFGGIVRGTSALARMGGFASAAASPAGLLGGGGAGPVPVYVTNLGPAGLVGPAGGSLPGGASGASVAAGEAAVLSGGRRVPLVGGFPAGGIFGPSGQRLIGGVPAAALMSGRYFPAGASVARAASPSALSMMAGGGGFGLPAAAGPGLRVIGGRAVVAGLAGVAVGGGVYGLSRGLGASRGVSSVLAGASGGATTGAMIGSLAGPGGAVAGALAGAAVGGLTAGFMQFAHSQTAAQVGQKAAADFAKGLGAGAATDVGAARARYDAAVKRRQNVGLNVSLGRGGNIAGADVGVSAATRNLGTVAGKALSDGLLHGSRFTTSGDVAAAILKRLDKLPPGARAIAAKAAVGAAQELSKKGRMEGSADDVVKRVKARYGDLETALPASAKKAAKQYAAGLKLDRAVAATGKSMKAILSNFTDAPKLTKTSADNIKQQYSTAMDFLAKKARSSNPAVAKAAQDMQGKLQASYDRVVAANKKVAATGASTAASLAASGALGATSGLSIALGWENSATRVEAASSRIVAAGSRAANAGRGARAPGGRARGGREPGPYRGVDDRLVPLAGDEVVLTPMQQMMVPGGRHGLDSIIARTGGYLPGAQGLASGGRLPVADSPHGGGWNHPIGYVVVSGAPSLKGLTGADLTDAREQIKAAIRQARTENIRVSKGEPRSGSARTYTDRSDAGIAARHRDDSLQDKKIDAASRAESKKAGITNPDLIDAKAQKAVDEQRKSELDRDHTDVVNAAKKVQAAIPAQRRKLKGLYLQLRKTSAFNRSRRESLLNAIAAVRQKIRDLYDEHRALITEAADIQATADELGYDIGQLADQIATLPTSGGATADQTAADDQLKAQAASAVAGQNAADSFVRSLGTPTQRATDGAGNVTYQFVNQGVMHPFDTAAWLVEALSSAGHGTSSSQESGA